MWLYRLSFVPLRKKCGFKLQDKEHNTFIGLDELEFWARKLQAGFQRESLGSKLKGIHARDRRVTHKWKVFRGIQEVFGERVLLKFFEI